MKNFKQLFVFILLLATYGSALSKTNQALLFSSQQLTKSSETEEIFSLATPNLIATTTEFSLVLDFVNETFPAFNSFLNQTNGFGFKQIKGFNQLKITIFVSKYLQTTFIKTTLFPFHSFL